MHHGKLLEELSADNVRQGLTQENYTREFLAASEA
jgi:peptide/nickel transport system ATP-binding protein